MDIEEVPLIGSIPPGVGSTFVTGDPDDIFYRTYADRKENITLVTIGSHSKEDSGSSCYHNKLNVAEMFFHHLLDSSEDLVIGDVTAGVDNLGTSLFMAYDLCVFVVEPTDKSVSVYKDFIKLTADLPYKIKTAVIVNKVYLDCVEDKKFILKHIEEKNIIGFIEYSRKLKILENDSSDTREVINPTVRSIFDEVFSRWSSIKRDKDGYYRELVRLYKDRCYGWWNDFSGKKLDSLHEEDTSFIHSTIKK
jgi:CO dehydrogenase maturation factor